VSTTATAGNHVGTYPINVSPVADRDYSITYLPGTLTVTPAPLAVTPMAGQSMTFGDTVPALTYTYTGLVNKDTCATFRGALATTASSSCSVGGYAITQGMLAALGNYTIGKFTPGALTITPAHLAITANSSAKLYGAALPAFSASYSGFVNGDSAASLTMPLTLSTTATAASHVGSYTIIASGASSINYTISYVPGILVITPAPLTITANNSAKVYGAAMPTLYATYSGWVNGDRTASLAALPTLTTSATASSQVRAGGYNINASGATDPDYSISYRPGTLLITPEPLTITANNASMVQGTATPALSASYSGFVNGDSPASLSTQPTLSTSATSVSQPGIYAILVGGASSPNYAINYANGILLVWPAPVNVLKVSVEPIRLGKAKKTTQVILVQFSGAMNAADAQSTSSYTLTTIPANKRQKSKSVALSQAQYNATTNTVTLITRKPLVLNPPIRLTLNPARLLDSYSDPLSGNSVATLSKHKATF
jgi:hypothetical protein